MKKLTIPLLLLLICGGRLGAETQKTCQLQGTKQVTFGTYYSAALPAQGSIYVYCNTAVAYTLAIGAGYGGSVNYRTLDCGNCTPATLHYELFSDAAYSVTWGNQTATEVNAVGNGNTQTFTIYGLIPALEAYYTGSNSNYIDTVPVTLSCPNCQNVSSPNGTLNLNLQTVTVGCGITATDLNFGDYSGTVKNVTTTIQVGCSDKTNYKVGLSAGNGAGATTADRRMTLTGGSALLKYQMHQGSFTGANWGNTAGTDTVSGTGDGTTHNLTVYGVIPAGQSVTQGTYTDTITATLTY
jgi:spore coat protein U-like protein